MSNPSDDLSLTSGLDEADFRAVMEEMTAGKAEEAEPELESKEVETPSVEEDTPEPETAEADPEADEPEEKAADEADEAEKSLETDDKDDDDLTRELAHLPMDVREQFSNLDKPAQKLVLDRYKHLEGRFDQKFKEAADIRKTAEEQIRTAKQFDDVLKPYQQHLAEAALSPAQAVQQVLALRDGLVKDPVAGIAKIADEFLFSRGEVGSPRAQSLIRQLAKRARVDLEGLDEFDDAPSAQPSPEAETIAQLHQTVRQLQERIDSSEQAGRDLSVAQGQRLWERFREDPANRHAERLETEILDQLGSRGAKQIIDADERLKWAYERAVMADPAAHQERLAEEREALRKDLLAEQDKQRKQQSDAVRKVPPSKAKAASTAPKPATPVTKNPVDADGDFSPASFKAVHDELFGGGASRV